MSQPAVTSVQSFLLKGRVVIDRAGHFDVTVTWNDQSLPVAIVDMPTGETVDLAHGDLAPRLGEPSGGNPLVAAALVAWDKMVHEYPLPGAPQTTYNNVVIVPPGFQVRDLPIAVAASADLIVAGDGIVVKDRFGPEGARNPAALTLALTMLEQGQAQMLRQVMGG